MFNNMEVKEVVFIFPTEQRVLSSGQRGRQTGLEIVGWRENAHGEELQRCYKHTWFLPGEQQHTTEIQKQGRSVCFHPRYRDPVEKVTSC